MIALKEFAVRVGHADPGAAGFQYRPVKAAINKQFGAGLRVCSGCMATREKQGSQQQAEPGCQWPTETHCHGWFSPLLGFSYFRCGYFGVDVARDFAYLRAGMLCGVSHSSLSERACRVVWGSDSAKTGHLAAALPALPDRVLGRRKGRGLRPGRLRPASVAGRRC